jgi:hypothetical protein
MSAADYRRDMARKLWRGLSGWSNLHWTPSKKDLAVLAYWEKRGHIEHSDHMIRLTEAGREALTNGERT